MFSDLSRINNQFYSIIKLQIKNRLRNNCIEFKDLQIKKTLLITPILEVLLAFLGINHFLGPKIHFQKHNFIRFGSNIA